MFLLTVGALSCLGRPTGSSGMSGMLAINTNTARNNSRLMGKVCTRARAPIRWLLPLWFIDKLTTVGGAARW